MTIEIFNFEQGTPEWFACRSGIPTASEFDTVMAKGKGGGESVTRRKYMLKLIGELMTGDVADSYTNANMERGHVMEPDAREMYAFMTDVDPKTVGFIRNGNAGCSPDSLVGENGLLEIKTKLPHLHLEVLLSDEMPSDHRAQVQGQIWIAEREWCDFVSYWPKLPLFVKRVYRDDLYIKRLIEEVGRFNDELSELMEKNSWKRAA